MAFSDLQKKTGGRKKGTPNKITSKVKSMMESFLSENQEEFIDAWWALPDLEKVKMYLKVAEFVVPKPRPAILETDEDDVGFTVTLR